MASQTENPNSTALIIVISILATYYAFLLMLHAIAIFYGTYLFTRKRKLCKFPSSVGPPLAVDENGNPTTTARNGTTSNDDNSAPFVSILKPLCGSAIRLEENLESFFQLDYPNYEILFCIQSEDDKCVPICRKLQTKYASKISSKLFIDYTNVGTNPKINNMMKAWDDACARRSSLLWICDAGVYVEPNTLSEMAARVMMSDKIAVCHGMPYCKAREGMTFGELVEKTYFGTQHGRHYLTWNFFRMNCMNGKSTLIKRHCFDDAIGSLANLGQYVAEDFFMGKMLVDDSGYRVVLSQHPIQENTEFPENINTLKRFTTRMVRWTRLRMTMIPGVSIGEPFSESMISGSLICGVLIAVLYPFDWLIGIYFLCGHFCLWFTLDCILQFTIDGDLFRYDNIFRILAAWIVREFLTVYIIVRSVINLGSIVWGERKFNVVAGGESQRVPDTAQRKNSTSSAGSTDSSMLDSGHGGINETFEDDQNSAEQLIDEAPS